MELLLLRGQVPSFRPDRLEYSGIDDCEDMWTVLAERLSRHLGPSEMWYWGARKHKVMKVTPKFTERRIQGKFAAVYNAPWKYVLARGGFPEYDAILRNVGKAKRVYYGAGARFYPQPGTYRKYHLILVDTDDQAAKVEAMVKTGKVTGEVTVLPKPAAPLFKPVDVEKDFDICFPANPAKFKGHTELFKLLAGSKLKILCIGLRDEGLEKLARQLNVKATFVGWHRRRKLPKLYSKCKVGVVMTHGKRDSCPRVIPEMIACNLPVVVADHVNVSDAHINSLTGVSVPEKYIRRTVKHIIKEMTHVESSSRAYYEGNITVDKVAGGLANMLKGL